MPNYDDTLAMDELETTNTTRIWPILWREKYVILASIVVMMALALVYTAMQPKVYQASAIIQVDLPTSTPGTNDTTAGNQALAQNYAALLVSPGFLNEARPRVEHGALSVAALQSRLTATALTQSALVRLDATGPSPQDAQTVAQEVITSFLANLQGDAASRTRQLETQLQMNISTLNREISALHGLTQSAAVTEQIASLQASRQALIGQNATLVANGLAQGTSATLSAAPVAASDPISPKRSLNLIAGLVLGIVLGIALAWLRHSLRPAIQSADDVAALVDVPLLASIPLKPRFRADDPSVADAYGVLNANLTFALGTRGKSVVSFIGYNAEVGKTSTVEGLAKAASRTDHKVLIVDGDMRAATLSARYGYNDHSGLVDVLQGAVPLDVALVQVEPWLWLLPTRPARVNPAGLLSGSRTFELMREFRQRFDLVLIDSPPISGLADGLILASQSDMVVLVVRAGVTKPADLAATTTSLRHNRTPVAGMVVFEELRHEPYYGSSMPDSKASRSAAVAR